MLQLHRREKPVTYSDLLQPCLRKQICKTQAQGLLNFKVQSSSLAHLEQEQAREKLADSDPTSPFQESKNNCLTSSGNKLSSRSNSSLHLILISLSSKHQVLCKSHQSSQKMPFLILALQRCCLHPPLHHSLMKSFRYK